MPAGALERAVCLLARLGEDSGEVTVPALAGDTGMPTSTAYRLLAELEQHGLVQRGPDSTVALGLRVVALGRAAETHARERLVVPATNVMEALSRRLGETVILTVPCGLEAIVLHVVEAELHPMRLTYAAFRRGPLDRGASGKVLAAYLEATERARLLEEAAEPGLEAALDEIRQAGFVVTRDEVDRGASAAAAPILDRRGRLIAGLSAAGPTERMASRLEAIVDAVVRGARAIERTIERASES